MKQATYEPNIAISLIDDSMIKNVAAMTQVRTSQDDPPMVFHYDTTYNTGEYYISTLSVRYVLMVSIVYELK